MFNGKIFDNYFEKEFFKLLTIMYVWFFLKDIIYMYLIILSMKYIFLYRYNYKFILFIVFLVLLLYIWCVI